MSTYVTMEGWIAFDNAKDLVEAVDILDPWLDNDGVYLREDKHEITVEYGLNRNLGYVIDDVLKHSDKHYLVEFCTDGQLYGMVHCNGGSRHVKIEEWYQKDFPREDEFDSRDEYDEAVNQWYADAEEAFLANTPVV